MRVSVALLPAALLLWACASEPETAASEFARAASEGNSRAALDRLDPTLKETLGPKLPLVIEVASREADAKGGVKSIDTEPVAEDGDRARVRMTTTYHDGTKDVKVVRLRRVDGRWYVSQ